MKNNVIKVCTIFLMIFLVSCGENPMDTKITKENYEKVVEKIRKKASKEDYEKTEAIISLSKIASMGGDHIALIEGKSFNEIIINMQEAQEREEERRLQKARREAKKAEILGKYLESINWEKSTYTGKYGFNKSVVIKVLIKNKTNKNIDAFEGVINIFDKLKNQLASLGVKSTSSLKKNSQENVGWKFSTIDYENKMEEIYNTKAEDLYFEFKPTKVLLEDGKIIQ